MMRVFQRSHPGDFGSQLCSNYFRMSDSSIAMLEAIG
jgi:hypothetical protein